jgi:hypothetical protein
MVTVTTVKLTQNMDMKMSILDVLTFSYLLTNKQRKYAVPNASFHEKLKNEDLYEHIYFFDKRNKTKPFFPHQLLVKFFVGHESSKPCSSKSLEDWACSKCMFLNSENHPPCLFT